MSVMPYAKIIGSGSYLPPKVVSNDDLAADLATRQIVTSDTWITERTGIRQRHIAEPGVKNSSLAIAEGRAALDHAGMAGCGYACINVASKARRRVWAREVHMVMFQG